MTQRLLRRKLDSKSYIYAPTFPRLIERGASSVAWIGSEVQEWIKSLVASSRKKLKGLMQEDTSTIHEVTKGSERQQLVDIADILGGVRA